MLCIIVAAWVVVPWILCLWALTYCWYPVAGVLGENLIIPDFLSHDVSKFWILNGSVLAFCILVFYLIILCLKKKRLMWPDSPFTYCYAWVEDPYMKHIRHVLHHHVAVTLICWGELALLCCVAIAKDWIALFNVWTDIIVVMSINCMIEHAANSVKSVIMAPVLWFQAWRCLCKLVPHLSESFRTEGCLKFSEPILLDLMFFCYRPAYTSRLAIANIAHNAAADWQVTVCVLVKIWHGLLETCCTSQFEQFCSFCCNTAEHRPVHASTWHWSILADCVCKQHTLLSRVWYGATPSYHIMLKAPATAVSCTAQDMSSRLPTIAYKQYTAS